MQLKLMPMLSEIDMGDAGYVRAVHLMQEYIHTSLSERFALQDVAKAAGYSSFHALRMFRNLTGKTPLEYARSLRLTQAAMQLRDGRRRIIDIAADFAFDTHEGFSRAFYEEFGVSPQIYRRELPRLSFFAPRAAGWNYLREHKNREKMLLYTGYGRNNDSNTAYNRYSDSQLDRLLLSPDRAAFSDYIITPGMAYYGLRECVTPQDVDSLVVEGTAANRYCGTRNPDDLEIIREQGLKHLRAAPPERTLDSLVREETELALRIIKKSPKTRLWLALPSLGFGELEVYAWKFAAPFCTFVDSLKNALDAVNPAFWRENIAGIHWGTWDIVQWYTRFETTEPKDFGNPVVYCARAVSEHVHSHYSKPLLWIPVFRNDANNRELLCRLAHVANTTDIFDAVDLQSSYYFGFTDSTALVQIKSCVDNDTVCDTDGSEVVAKTAATRIGFEMEIDGRYGSDAVKRERYLQCLKLFKPYRGRCPVGFYAGDDTELFSEDTYAALRAYFGGKRKYSPEN